LKRLNAAIGWLHERVTRRLRWYWSGIRGQGRCNVLRDGWRILRDKEQPCHKADVDPLQRFGFLSGECGMPPAVRKRHAQKRGDLRLCVHGSHGTTFEDRVKIERRRSASPGKWSFGFVRLCVVGIEALWPTPWISTCSGVNDRFEATGKRPGRNLGSTFCSGVSR